MRILQLHSDFIEFEPVKREVAEAEESDGRKQRVEDALVLFTAVEEGDSEETARQAVKDVEAFLDKIKGRRILIYPYAHLSSNLAKPREALHVIKEMETSATEAGLEVYRAPFGWNKQFSISVKGHPLAEQARTYQPTQVSTGEEGEEEVVSEALKAEERLKSDFFIMNLNGDLVPVDQFDFSAHQNLQKFVAYEQSKVRAVAQVPPHITLMKRLEMVDNEPGSDAGNLRYYPKGRLIKSLLEQFVTQKVVEYGGMEVETPIMYDLEHPSLASYLHRFPARQYVVRSEGRDFFLRFSACFGQFLMVHDTQFSYRQLPFRIYELTRYSFRREKSGELVGLRRLRAFTMPDVHALCGDMAQALEEAVRRFKLSMQVLSEGLELGPEDFELAVRFTQDFYNENKDFVFSLIQLLKKPTLIEIWPERFFYFTLKWEFNFVDNLDKASALSTDQIDVENAERYDLTYVDERGQKQHPIILHCSPSGAIERCIYALLEKAHAEMVKGRVPKLPLWLTPTQVRLIPISNRHVDACILLAEDLKRAHIRVDVDDRELTVSNRIRQAEQEWIPYIIVFGEREVYSKELAVRKREQDTIEKMALPALIEEVEERVRDKPYQPLPLPLLVSQRPIFVG
ncbi:MAG: threonine--tRNA ligase [Candidatus Bathyarchaeota archaeon]|nr:threonine--tRNA ligase [Candidatus Bathyarchaeota archaeon]